MQTLPKGVQYTLLVQLDIDYSLHVPYPLHFFHGIEYVYKDWEHTAGHLCKHNLQMATIISCHNQ